MFSSVPVQSVYWNFKYKMNFVKIFLIACHLIPAIFAGISPRISQNSRPLLAQQRIQNNNRRITPEWIQKNCGGAHFPPRSKFVKRQSDGDSGSDSDSNSSDSSSDSGSDSSSSSSMMNTLKGLIKRIPQTNFYSSIPNAVGVVGQGFSVLEKLSIALGTPLPYWIGSLPICAFGIFLVFIPDLTTLNLPGFYPAGAGDNDPLAAFPPKPNLDAFPDVDLTLSADNIPPRLIPPTTSPNAPVTLLDNGAPPPPPEDSGDSDDNSNFRPFTEEEADSPTNPESFQSPRRRIDMGGAYGGGGVVGGANIHFHPSVHHNMIPRHNNYNHNRPPIIINSQPI